MTKKPVYHFNLTLNNEYGATRVNVPFECFTEGVFNMYENLQQFDFGYVLTVHKAQGSEWPAVRLFNEKYAIRDSAQCCLGITRARERLTIVNYY